MRSTPDQDARLQARLQEAVVKFAGGSADLFGRLLGYANGGYIRELLKGPKPVRTAIIERTHATPGMEGWFDPVLLPTTAADLATASPAMPAKAIQQINLAHALAMVLDALAATPETQRDELAQVLSLLARTGAPAYRDRLIQLLDAQARLQGAAHLAVIQPNRDRPMRQISSPFGRSEADQSKKVNR